MLAQLSPQLTVGFLKGSITTKNKLKAAVQCSLFKLGFLTYSSHRLRAQAKLTIRDQNFQPQKCSKKNARELSP